MSRASAQLATRVEPRPDHRFRLRARAAADGRFGDIPIARHESSDLASGALAVERPKRFCVGSTAFLHAAVPALLAAMCRSAADSPFWP